MIRVQITVDIDGVTITYDKEAYSTKVAGGQASMNVDKAQSLLLDGHDKLMKALESQR